MINFDGVNFSEHRSEKEISFFWCSVYNNDNNNDNNDGKVEMKERIDNIHWEIMAG